jgi:hypothetical protein
MNSTTAATNPLELCQAVMLGLGPRRYLIVRRERPSLLHACGAASKRIRDLQPGDEVIYRGERVVVRSVEVYE